MHRHGPLFGRLPDRQKQQFQRCVGKSSPRFDDLAQRAMQCLHAVGGIDRLANLRGIMEKRRDAIPVPLPHLADARIGASLQSYLLQILLSFLRRGRTIDPPQI